MLTLGIETSCDETSVALTDGDGRILSNVVFSSLDEHRRYGGVVPEIASRAQLEVLPQCLDAALKKAHVKLEEVDLVAVTQGPGLMGPLLVGLSAAKARAADVVLVDTAGRLHTKKPLLDELSKLDRVMGKFALQQERYLVLDATMGQNGLAQARVFSEALPVDAAILTKWDGSAKGGVLFAIGRELGLPVAFVGVGEGMGDLEPFDPEQFITALFEA